MKALASLRFRDLIDHPRWTTPEKPGQHCKSGQTLLQLPRCDLQQSDLTAVSVKKY
tara:strand:+ start:488 stop:655 length:168 start_codon:yes stop_codon:yes gene_type:complete